MIYSRIDMYNIPEDYEIGEKDVDSAIRWLKIIDPENATPDNAIDYLIYMRTYAHQEWHKDPKKLEQSYKDYQAWKKRNKPTI